MRNSCCKFARRFDRIVCMAKGSPCQALLTAPNLGSRIRFERSNKNQPVPSRSVFALPETSSGWFTSTVLPDVGNKFFVLKIQLTVLTVQVYKPARLEFTGEPAIPSPSALDP